MQCNYCYKCSALTGVGLGVPKSLVDLEVLGSTVSEAPYCHDEVNGCTLRPTPLSLPIAYYV
jgi:hypothetical protein